LVALPRPIRVRKLGLRFEDVPRRWLYDNAVITHVANGLNLVFPAGERFFIRSVKHYFDRIEDPKLRERCRAFFGQEASHGKEHERFFEIMESQGFEIREYLRWYEQLAFESIEPRVPPNLRLSVTVALEHFTATLAERGLTTPFLDGAHPVMRQLLRWHAAEEIEHKSVAFDVLREVDDRYWVRVAGLVLATVGLMYFWRRGSEMLIAQEGLPRKEVARQRKLGKELGQGTGFLLDGILSYLRPGFHPDKHDNYHLARGYLEAIGRYAS
jgi:predicted metal-dependent hydrolase